VVGSDESTANEEERNTAESDTCDAKRLERKGEETYNDLKNDQHRSSHND
jgi:hypothetical protein